MEAKDVREDQALGEDPRFFTEEGAFDLPRIPWLRGYRCRYRQAQYSDDLFVHHGVPLPPDLCSAVPCRKGEFLAGRHAAQKALQRWGLEGARVSIGRHRCPVWPIGWVGSITHDGATAISAAACAEGCLSQGIDLATWFYTKDAVSLADYIVQREETRILAECAPSPRPCPEPRFRPAPGSFHLPVLKTVLPQPPRGPQTSTRPLAFLS